MSEDCNMDCNMDQDIKHKKADFIDKSTEVRETFNFAEQKQVLSAVQTYCSDFYGSLLWNLFGEPAEQYFRCWNTCVKL